MPETLSTTNTMATERENEILAHSKPHCYLCGTEGVPIYANLRDRISTAPGEWNYKRCNRQGCGLWWLDPMPRPEDIGKAYRDYFTHDGAPTPTTRGTLRRFYQMAKRAYLHRQFGYASEKSIVASTLGRVFSLLPNWSNQADAGVMYLPATGCGRLLDVGCGSGAALQLMETLGWSTEGIDFDPIIVQNAKSKGLNVHLGSLSEQQFNDHSFDAVVMSHVIEHVPDPLALLQECRRVLKPFGRLVILTPNVDSWGHRHFQRAWLFLDPPRHLHLFNKATLTESAARAGLTTQVARTSSRTAARMVVGSSDISKYGKHDIGTPLSGARRFQSEAAEFAEWVYSKFDSSAGEEIVFIASRNE